MAELNSVSEADKVRAKRICEILDDDVDEWLDTCSKFPNPVVVIDEWEQIAEAYQSYSSGRQLPDEEKEEAVGVIQDVRATLKANEMFDDDEEPDLDELIDSYDLSEESIRRLVAIVVSRKSP